MLGRSVCWAICTLLVMSGSVAKGQTFGIELHNNLMPASGGMAGASVARPQDLQSAINGNPATLRQFQGTQFSFGGAWADANYKVSQADSLPLLGVDPFSATSDTLGALLGNIGLTQDMDAFGLPATMGLGLMSNAGAGVDFRDVAASNGTSAQYLALDLVAAAGMDLTEQLSLGASFAIGTSYLDGPFVDLGGMTPDYGVRFSAGANYQITPTTSLGAYWQSKKNFNFENAALVAGGTPVDVAFDHPMNVGLGFANSSLMKGRLLFAADAIYKMHSEADTLKSIYRDQWAVQVGSQFAATEHTRLRLGYAYNENPMKTATPGPIGGVTFPAVEYVQGQFAAITQHRITTGVGVCDILPGIDFDLFAGYAFEATDQLGATQVNIDGNYWIGFGTTWRFGGPVACEEAATAL